METIPKKYSILALGGIIILSLLVLILLKRNPAARAEPLKAIPADASLIIRVNNYHNLLQEINTNSLIWQELKNISEFSNINSQFLYFDSLLQYNTDARKILHDNPSFISAHFTGKARIGLIFYFSLPKGIQEKKVSNFFHELIADKGSIISRTYQGKKVYDATIQAANKKNHFSFSIANNLLIYSYSSILLEDALRQLDLTKSIIQDHLFMKLLAAAGKNVYANVFVNYQYFPKMLSILSKESQKEKVRNYTHFASWAELDLNMKENLILLNGFTAYQDSMSFTSAIFANQNTQELKVVNTLPSSISTFISFGISNIERYLNDYKNHLQKHGKLLSYQQQLDILNSQCNTDMCLFFKEITDSEITLALADNKSNIHDNAFILIHARSESAAKRLFLQILEKTAQLKSVPVSRYKNTYTLDEEYHIEIYHFPVKQFVGKILGELFNQPRNSYVTFYNNYMIIGNSIEALTNFIHSNVLHKTLNTNYVYKQFSEAFSTHSNITFYTNLSRSLTNYSKFLTSEILTKWEEHIHVFQKNQALGFQLKSSGGMLFTNLALMHISDYKDKPHTVWESLLDTVSNFKPAFVINHYTQEKEVFLQDLQHHIYLINKAGRILWKIRLPEKIISEIYQIDYYKNEKLQILFNTKNHLYVIDRNGNYVEGYPKRFREEATNGIALFDYDNNLNYRIAVACADRRVYMYDKEGTILPGWKFQKSEAVVTQPLKHFRIGDKDYIVFGDRLKTYILNRRGEDRVVLSDIFEKSQNNNYILEHTPEKKITRLAITNSQGTVYFLYFDGHTETIELGNFTPAHYFDYKDMNGDGSKDFIYLDGSTLTVFKQNYKTLFTREFENTIDMAPIYFYFSYMDRKLGIADTKNNKIYLINNTGKDYKGFPLNGSTSFSIGYFNPNAPQFNLIVGNEDNFLYNYSVN